MKRQEYFDGTETSSCYCRTVKAGSFVFIAGTTSISATGEPQGRTAGEQVHIAMQKILAQLKIAGASYSDVVRLTIFCTDMNDRKSISEALTTYAQTTRPACALIGVSSLVRPGLLVEIETTAVICEA